MSEKLIFVYGTLQRGQVNDINRYTPSPEFLGEGWVAGTLYDLGHCPALRLDEAGTPVFGELYLVHENLFQELDRWEAQCGDFVLSQAAVETGHGTVMAHLYVAGPTEQLPSVPHSANRWRRAAPQLA